MLWGIDLGGTKIELCILENRDNLSPLLRKRVATPKGGDYKDILQAIAGLVREGISTVGVAPDLIGFGTPGVLDPRTNRLKNSNTQALNGHPLQEDLRQILQTEIKIENDANCSALAEACFGAGRGEEVVFGVILGTGVGGGVVVNQRIIRGRQGVAGEWGHNVVEHDGAPCYCGKNGCVEMCIAGPALERHYRDLSGVPLELKQIFQGYRDGSDPHAKKTMERLVDVFGRSIAMVINILDPDVIVLAGGVSNIDLLYSQGAEAARRSVFNPNPDIKIVKNELGDSAGVFGAALLI